MKWKIKTYQIYIGIIILTILFFIGGISFAYFLNNETNNATIKHNVTFDDYYSFSSTINGTTNGVSNTTFDMDSFEMFGANEDVVVGTNTDNFEISVENKDQYNAIKCEFDYVWEWDSTSDNYTKSNGATNEFTVSGPWGETQIPNTGSADNVLASDSVVRVELGTETKTVPITTKFYNLTNVNQSAHAGKNYKGSVKIDNVSCKQVSFCVKTTNNKLSDCLIVVDDYIDDLDTAKATIEAKTTDFKQTEPTIKYEETYYERATSSSFTSTSNGIYYSTQRPEIDASGQFKFSSANAIWGTVEDAVTKENGIKYYTCMNQTNTCGATTMYVIYAYRTSGSTYYITEAERYVSTATNEYVDNSGLYAAVDDYGMSYYYRGAVKNNYVKFGKDSTGNDMYWRIVRINGDGTIRMIYQGTSPTATGYDTGILNSKGSQTMAYNAESQDATYVGYKYGLDLSDNVVSTTNNLTRISLSTGSSYYFAKSMDCDDTTKKCSLGSDKKAIKWGDYSTTKDMPTYKYTCWSTSATESCSVYSEVVGRPSTQTSATVKWHGYLSKSASSMYTDENDSNIKTELDLWYEKTFLTSNNENAYDGSGVAYEDYIADTLFCNDRDIYSGDPTTLNVTTYFWPYHRFATDSPSLVCRRQADEFTVSTTNVNGTNIGNAELDYSIGLITSDEVIYAGASRGKNNSKYYLYTGSYYLTMSPYLLSTNTTHANVFTVRSSGSYESTYVSTVDRGVRPVINLSSEVLFVSGTGTVDNAYTVAMPDETT